MGSDSEGLTNMPLSALDYVEIEQLISRSAQALDLGDEVAYGACYTEDGSFEVLGIPPEAPHAGRHVGRKGVAGAAKMIFSGCLGHVRHWNNNQVITGEGNTATMVSYLQVIRVGMTPNSGVILTGIYWDKLEKIDGKWLLKERLIRTDPQPEHNTAPTDVLVIRRDEFVQRV
jgi:hypothetical protein